MWITHPESHSSLKVLQELAYMLNVSIKKGEAFIVSNEVAVAQLIHTREEIS